MSKLFYVTTAIAYTSRKPHIGNTYDVVLADMIARYKRMMGFDVYFLTGSDEHGQKIEQAAKAAGVEPKEYVDGIAAQIKEVWDCLNVTYDRFIRTTDADHQAAVQAIFKKLYEQGDIYKGYYEGKYCVPCESFFTASQLEDGKCPDCGREVTDAKEEAYFLRLSKYQDRLLQYYNDNPDFFLPDSRRAEMVNNFLKPGLSDLCVSRTSFKWGIPVEFDPGHVIYVWLDALSNYITGLGYHPDSPAELYQKFWPADVHVIGKDIVRFHTIYWPIILMALGEPLPKQVLGHPWLLFGEEKMSKSRGNVLYADDLVRRFGTDAVRFYLLSEIPFAQDGSITYRSFIAKYNTDLANILGNLVNRSVAMAGKYFDGKVTKPTTEWEPIDQDLQYTITTAVADYHRLMDSYHNADAVDVIINLARRCNKYIDETMPWILAKQESTDRLNHVLYHLLTGVRALGYMLTPIMPQTASSILQQTGDGTLPDSFLPDTILTGQAKPLFARLDVEKTLAEIEAELAAQAEAAEQSAKEPTETATEQAEQEPSNLIDIGTFGKVDLRVATVTACEPIPKANKLLKLTLDDGSSTPRTVCSGIAPWYSAEDLVGRQVILVANLKPAVLRGVESRGMILAAEDGDQVRVVFADGCKPGSQVR